MPIPPLLLIDNRFDTVNLYPNASRTSYPAAAVGHEVRYAADYRRERSWWQPSHDGGGAETALEADLGAGQSAAIDYVFIDRGHNLWGKTIAVKGGTAPGVWDLSVARVVPALGTVGGDPLTTVCVTEEGALYMLFPAFAPRRVAAVTFSWAGAFFPVITGLMVGARTQLSTYSNIFDEDASERTNRTETGDSGYRARGRTYSWRVGELGLEAIGAAEYDATIRTVKSRIFDGAQPFVLAMDYTTHPERAWMFEYEGNRWGMPKRRVSRAGRIPIRELGQAIH